MFRSAVILVISIVNLCAQTSTGSVQGTVTDQSGAPTSGARLKLTETSTGLSREQTTGVEGNFEFHALPRGNYQLEAEHPGFKKELVTGILLQVAQTQRIDVKLQVGAVTESVEARGAADLLQVSESSLSQLIDQKRVLDLPINGRHFMQLIGLSSGVINAGRASATQRQANYGPAFSVGGQRDNTSVVLVDGIEISGQEINNYPLAIPPQDSLGEFRVQTANYPAEFGGNSGAVINVVSKRGSNDFHSTLFEFLRNEALDARNPFNATVDPLRRNQFGVVARGAT